MYFMTTSGAPILNEEAKKAAEVQVPKAAEVQAPKVVEEQAKKTAQDAEIAAADALIAKAQAEVEIEQKIYNSIPNDKWVSLGIVEQAALQKPLEEARKRAKLAVEAKAAAVKAAADAKIVEEAKAAAAAAHAKKAPTFEAKKAVVTEKKKQEFLFTLRVKLSEGLKERFNDKDWTRPSDAEIQDTKKNIINIVNKKGDAGCQMTMDQEVAKFQLTSASDASYEAAKNCLDSYLDSYKAWRKLHKDHRKPDRDLIYDLTVYDESHIKPFLAKLGDLNITKITIIDVTGNKKEITEAKDIDAYKNKPVAAPEAAPTAPPPPKPGQ